MYYMYLFVRTLVYLHPFPDLIPSLCSLITCRLCFLASGVGKLSTMGQTHYPRSAFVITVVILLFDFIAFQHITSQQTL